MAAKANFKDTDMQSIIGWVLRAGVIVSISIVFFGGIIYMYRHGQAIADHKHYKGVPNFIRSAQGVFNGIITLRGQAIIQFGIILLIATPVLRVAFSTIGFILEKDYMYVSISAFVLLIIFTSMLSGYIG